MILNLGLSCLMSEWFISNFLSLFEDPPVANPNKVTHFSFLLLFFSLIRFGLCLMLVIDRFSVLDVSIVV